MALPHNRAMPRFREDKTTQAAARLLKLGGGKMNHMKLIKLLYLAERQALLRWGRPITFDAYSSMPHGPVLSFTLDKINEVPPREGDAKSYWQEFISERQDHEVRLLVDAPNDQLSSAEEQVIDEIFAKFGHMNQWELRDYTHTLPEWQDPNGSSLPIRIRDILLAEGLSDDDVREVEDSLRAEALAESFAGV
jgi:uncharacterized phage-associated protein